MGITIHYRGTIDDVANVETMEDRLLDLVFALGGRATIWRSYADHDPSRIVRGLMIEMAPGQDTLSLLISPEGHLTPLFQIEDAEKAPFDEPPCCFVKTQFGMPLGHVAIIHVLYALKQKYFSNLSITDEGGFYETGDFNELCKKMNFLGQAVKSLDGGLRNHGLSHEAAEDPNILASRIERIAALVHRKLIAESQHESGADSVDPESRDEDWCEPSLEQEIASFDRLRRKGDLRNERMMRRIAEATAAGFSTEEAFELAMQEEGLASPIERKTDESDSRDVSYDEDTVDESWSVDLSEKSFEEVASGSEREPHPSVSIAQDFVEEVMEFAKQLNSESSFIEILARASFEMMGGLVQATCDDMADRMDRALAISQLKRALNGHGFARGAVFGLSGENIISEEQSDSLHTQLQTILSHIHSLAERAWSEA
jgi:hypothetical protein